MLVVCTAVYVFLTYGIYYQSLPPVFTMGTCYWCLLPFTTSILDILEVSNISVYTTAVDTTSVDTTGVDTTGVDTIGVDTTGVDTTGVETTSVETTVYYIF